MSSNRKIMEDYPSISVIIPSFNQGQFIEETILSVIGQNYPNLEVLVLDGGSTDNTVEILQKYSDHLDYWHSQKDGGQADAINQGMEKSSGDIVCWLNSDDMYLPGTLLDIGKRFQGRTNEKLLIYGGALVLREDEESKFINGKSQLSRPLNDPFELTYKSFMVQPSAFWTKQLWKTAGSLNYKYNYMLDWEWFIRASKAGQFEYTQKCYSVYRYHPTHKTSTGGAKKLEEKLEVIGLYSSEYRKKLYSEMYNNRELIKKRLSRAGKIRLYGILIKLGVKNPFKFLFPKLGKEVENSEDFWIGLRLLKHCNFL